MLWKKKKSTTTKNSKKRTGFDNPLLDPAGDQLGRRKFADQVYDYLTNVERDWSVRVGLIAPWGEGKTTVAEWVATKAEKDGHIAVWYKPWMAKTDTELWLGFYNELVSALAEKEIKFDSPLLRQMAANISRHKVTQTIGDIHEYGKAGLGVLQAFAKITPEDIAVLNAAIGDKRVIVILDDLDRVEPHLIPRLLMSLRDLMDVEGFSFLLPFDDKMVSSALSEYNDAPGFGDDFLEKILDYRVHLPEVTEDGVLSFFKCEMEKHCHFVSVETIDGLARFLPKNPRKLKNLVRGMKVFEREGERHREDEIDWGALIFAQMIKAEHEGFYKRYVKDTFLSSDSKDPDDTSVSKPWLYAGMEEDKAKAQEMEKERITKIMNAVDVPDVPEKRDRIIDLCEGWRSSYGWIGQQKVYYALRFMDQPDAMTWAEFDAVWMWAEDLSFDSVFTWLKDHAENVERSYEDVIWELLKTVSYHYNQCLERAASVALQSEHATAVVEAEKALDFLDVFMDQDVFGLPMEKLLSVDVFGKFWYVVRQWENFESNEADKNLREKEARVAKKWIGKIEGFAERRKYAEYISKALRDDVRWRPKSAELSKELLALVSGGLEKMAINALKREDGVSKLFPDGAGEDIKAILLNVESAAWKPENGTGAVEVLAEAATNPAIQKNSRYLLDLIHKAAYQGTWQLRTETARKFYEHPEIVSVIWNAAIATPLQYRRLKETREERKHLLSVGIDEQQLPFPDWLRAGMEPETPEETPEELDNGGIVPNTSDEEVGDARTGTDV